VDPAVQVRLMKSCLRRLRGRRGGGSMLGVGAGARIPTDHSVLRVGMGRIQRLHPESRDHPAPLPVLMHVCLPCRTPAPLSPHTRSPPRPRSPA
jgi:hypothetical protein